MIVTKYICDKCGNEVSNDRQNYWKPSGALFDVRYNSFVTTEEVPTRGGGVYKRDVIRNQKLLLCVECQRKLYQFIFGKPDPKTAEIEDKPLGGIRTNLSDQGGIENG